MAPRGHLKRVLADFVTAEGVGIPPISTPKEKEKNTEKSSKEKNAFGTA